ncbi:MAG TPA: hypothetical protein VLT45_09120, partial [Kofleriaceae bacterium]|nr:hypothetical protein [Kofleriaceae bacterium]
RGSGAPDLVPLSAWPGIAGSHSVAQLGAEVLVQFIEGDPGQPVVTHFAGKDGVGWIPTEAILAASSLVRLGGAGASEGVGRSSLIDNRIETLRHDLAALYEVVSSGSTPPDIATALPSVASGKVVLDG